MTRRRSIREQGENWSLIAHWDAWDTNFEIGNRTESPSFLEIKLKLEVESIREVKRMQKEIILWNEYNEAIELNEYKEAIELHQTKMENVI